MVYHGLVSKGCERCRKRKIRCDQQRPACSRCERSKKKCPGYRSLSDILFRDESEKTIRKARQLEQSHTTACIQQDAAHVAKNDRSIGFSDTTPNHHHELPPLSMSYPLSQPIKELGANFYFAKYTLNEEPFSTDYHTWLAEAYFSGSQALCGAMEAVGMAGISNVYYAPHVLSKSREQYGRALAALNLALKSPVEAVADTTLMTVILLGMFETINFNTWHRYSSWAAHVRGAMTLLELRGKDQFAQKLGGLLFVLIRSQILTACMYQNLPVPQALYEISQNFQSSSIRREWQIRRVASPSSVSEISFRIVNLSAAIQNGHVTDSDTILTQASQIDRELLAWKATISHSWTYGTVDPARHPGDAYFDGKCHAYPRLWVAEMWNHWRALRILVNQIILRQIPITHSLDRSKRCDAKSIIRTMSTDICVSSSSFLRTPRMLSLLQQLYVVALEESNPRPLRYFATAQLQRIGTEFGIRQASLFARDILKHLDGGVTRSFEMTGDSVVQTVPHLLTVGHD